MSLYNASEEAGAPTTPAAGRQLIYPKSTGWYMKNSAGVESRIVVDGGNASLLVTTATTFTANTVQIGANAGGTNGYTLITDGSGARSGLVGFYSNTGVRQGYIGFSSGVAAIDAGTLIYSAGVHYFNGRIDATGGIVVTGGGQLNGTFTGTSLVLPAFSSGAISPTISDTATTGIGTVFTEEIVNTHAGTVGAWTGTVHRWVKGNANSNQGFFGAVMTNGSGNTESAYVWGLKPLAAVNAITEYMRLTTAGLSVTGAISATTGTFSGNLIGNGGAASNLGIYNNSSTGSTSLTDGSGSAYMTVYNTAHATKASLIEVVAGGALKGVWSGTGLAVTGSTSSTTAGVNGFNSTQSSSGGYCYYSNAITNGGTFYHASFTEGGNIRGSITSDGANTAYNTTSDYRIKSNQMPLTGSGVFIDALKPKTWTWDSGKVGCGFIAHEFQEISPSSVTGLKDAIDADGNPVYQTMQASSSEVMANIIAELQSLRARLAAAGI